MLKTFTLSIWIFYICAVHYLGSPISYCTLNVDLMRNLCTYNVYITFIYFNDWVGWLCSIDRIVPEAIHIPIAIDLLVYFFFLKYKLYMCTCFKHHGTFCIYLFFLSVLVICHFNIKLTEAGVMREAGYVYSIRSS